MKRESEKGKEEFFQIMSFLCREAKGWWLNLQTTLYLFYSYFLGRQVCFDLITCVPFCLHLKMLLRWSEWRPGIIETFKCSQTPTPSVFQFSSVTQSCPTLCDPMNCSTPGLPVHHQLLEFTQTHVHWVGDAIQPSHPVVLFSSYPQSLPASESFPMSQLFTWGGKVLKFQL